MTNRAASIYDFTLTANGSFVLPVEGSYYRILSSTGAVQVRRDGGSGLSPLQAGQGEKDQEFKRLTITDRSGIANIGLIIVGDSTFVDDRITGEVSVIDGEKARTLAGGMFMAAPVQNAVAGQYSHCQLWNPSANKNLIVTQMASMSTLACVVGIGFNAAALTTDASATTLANKLQTGAVGVAQARVQGNVVVLLSVVAQQLYVLANSAMQWPIKGALIVPPGKGLVAYSGIANQNLTTNFEWFEETI